MKILMIGVGIRINSAIGIPEDKQVQAPQNATQKD